MVDRISDLPDEVLCDILSFLPTQEAVKTSVLSKRWRHLWTSVPALDFDDQTCLKDVPISYFERIVHTTILARDVHQPITSFRLKYDASSYDYKRSDYNRSNADLNVWVNTATRCGIQNLDIEIFPLNYMIRLRSCILSCKTLVVLKLSGLSLNVSSSVELPSLKTLHLTNVEFVGLQYLIKLISGCPMLEDLETVWLDYDLEYDGYVSEEGFKLPNLVRAYIRSVDMVGANMLLKAACNTEFLILKQCGVDVIPEFPHLRHLTLFLDDQSWHSVLLMLKNCPKLQSFKLGGSFNAEDVLNYPHFAVPECLTSHFNVCSLTYYTSTKSDLQFAKYIMQNSTSLRSMKVHCVELNSLEKLEVLKDLAICSRKSTWCELRFV